MRATVVVDNLERDGLSGQWGLCVFIEYRGKRILLDTGASSLFAVNAEKLGLPLEEVDYAVLSHGHSDHANGMADFFRINSRAKFFLRDGCGENCYKRMGFARKYIGIPRGIEAAYPDRIVHVSGDFALCGGARLLPHTAPGLEALGRREKMCLRRNGRWVPDDFSHEQSLVLETSRGLVVFNSCSHGGAVNIIREAEAACPNQRVLALIGGLHLFNKTDSEVRALAGQLRDTGIEKVYTGHCTGESAYALLRAELGDVVRQFYTGLVMEFAD